MFCLQHYNFSWGISITEVCNVHLIQFRITEILEKHYYNYIFFNQTI